MRTWVGALVASIGWLPAAAQASDEPNITIDEERRREERRYESILPRHPAWLGFVALGLGVVSGARDPGIGGAVRLDSNAVPNLWFTGKLRLLPGDGGNDFHVDVLAGWAFSQERGPGVAVWGEKIAENRSYTTYQLRGANAVVRETWTVAGGAKIFTVVARENDPNASKLTQVALAAGIQNHSANDYNNHKTFEVLALYNPGGGGFGGIVEWYTAVPIGGRLIGGLQVGLIPVDREPGRGAQRMFTFAVELGASFGQ